jgi:hypothetical protein
MLITARMAGRGLLVAALATLAVGVSACGGGDAGASGGGTWETGAPTVTASPTASLAGAGPTTAAPVVLKDGRHAVYLHTLDTKKGRVTFDLIQFLTGEEAKKAWAKANPTEPGPPNDYLIMNDNAKLRTLPVATKVSAKLIDTSGTGGIKEIPSSFAELPGRLAAQGLKGPANALSPMPFWLTVAAGKITKIEQQYLP